MKRSRFKYSISTDNTLPYYGENQCQREGCSRNAYYVYENETNVLCGMHSRATKRRKFKLRPDPRLHEKRMKLLAERETLVENAAHANRIKGATGHVIVAKLNMMKQPPHKDGYRKVFPNFKHQNRVDGYGCKALSPMALGPVQHGQDGLPDAMNIENYHQFNKVFPNEVDSNGDPLPIFFERQLQGYLDRTPHRHKFPLHMMKQLGQGNKNTPLFSLHDGKRYTYVESRQFYCKQYEMLAKETKEFKELQKMIADGINLMIVGYDGYQDGVTQPLMDHYLDPSKPFGHELVLYSLLVIENPDDYPWNVYVREQQLK